MSTCAHFTQAGEDCCARGVDYMKLAGGGAFRMLLRLPCLPLSDRRGEEARVCAKFEAEVLAGPQQNGERQ